MRVGTWGAAVLVVAALVAAPVRAEEDEAARIDRLIAVVGGGGDDAVVSKARADLIRAGDAARFRIAEVLDDAGEQPELTAVLDDLGLAARLRAEAEGERGFAFWVAYSEARNRSRDARTVLEAAVPDAAQRKDVESVVEKVNAAVRPLGEAPAGAAQALDLQRLAASEEVALRVRLSSVALLAETAEERTAAIRAVASLRNDARSAAALTYLALEDAGAPAREAAAALVGYGAPPLPEEEADPVDRDALAAWWAGAAQLHDRAALRHLAHVVLLGMERPPPPAEVAAERVERLRAAIPGWDPWLHGLADDGGDGGDPPRLTEDSRRRLRDVWRWNPPWPASWRSAVADLRAARTYHGGAIGEGGDVSATRRASIVLAQDAPLDVLAQFAADAPPVLRLYALRGLMLREGPTSRALDLLVKLCHTPGAVEAQFGCCIDREPLSAAALNDLGTRDEAELRTVLHALVDRDVRSAPLSWLLERTPVDRSRRERLRAMAEDGWAPALGAIAVWRDPEDAAWFASRVEAAGDRLLDDETLLDALARHGATGTLDRLAALAPLVRVRLTVASDDRWPLRSWVAAIAAGNDAAAERALGEVLGPDVTKTSPRLRAAVETTLQAAPPGAFTDLRWRLWEALPWTRAAAVEALAAVDRARATRLVRRDVDRDLEAEGSPVAAVAPHAAVLHADDPEAARRWVLPRLEASDPELVAGAARAVAAWRDEALVDPLFGALGAPEHDNPYRYLPLVRVLLCYDRPEVDERLRRRVAEAAAFREGWGGEAVAKLLAAKPRTWESGERE